MPRCTINPDTEQTRIIVEQNDRFRLEILTQEPKSIPGRMVLSPSVRMMDSDFMDDLLLALSRAWNAHPVTDPNSERDCGEFSVRGEKFVWRIDLMAADQRAYSAADRSDLDRTWRVLTVKAEGEA